MPSKYLLTPPEGLHSLTSGNTKKIYPDFDPWSHTPLDDKIFLNFVSKGYYNSAKVNFESISSRSSLQESLPAVSGLLADQLSDVVRIREEKINRITANSTSSAKKSGMPSDLSGPGFSLPKRVTLTDHRRELWLQEMSSPQSSLSETSKTIPHGLKRRQLLEQCYLKQIPISRAIWLIKCCFSLEWKTLANKQGATQIEDGIDKLLKEWSETMVHLLERLVFEMTQYYNEPVKLSNWRQKIKYYLSLLGNCYSLNLMDSNFFHHWLVDFIAKIENFECLPMALHILTVFWGGIFEACRHSEDPQQLFLVNKMTEALLYKYYMVTSSRSMINDEQYLINDVKKNNKVNKTILAKLKGLIEKIFQEQSMEAFVFPNNNWDIYKKCLYEILQVDKIREDDGSSSEASKKLELIVYRNDSLKFNTILHDADTESLGSGNETPNNLENIFVPDTVLKLKRIDYKLTKALDENCAGDDWATFADQKLRRVEQVIQMMLWAVHPSRSHHYEASQLVAKLLLLKLNSRNGNLEYSLEDKIWALVFVFAKTKSEDLKFMVSLTRLHQLLNVFIGYGIVKVPTYIRKLISSGVLYLTHSSDKLFHCNLLINLKISPLMKIQYNMVLRNVHESNPEFYDHYNYDRLMEMLEGAKESLSSGNYEFVKEVPYSIKLMASEWYLNVICSPIDGSLRTVRKLDVIEKLKVFCVNLKVYHQFYKWVEFIVYHQLLNDLEALECLVDILMYYDKLFPLLINDHILLMKTILHLHSLKLAPQNTASQNLLLFNDFWLFFMKRFPLALEIDTDLQTKLIEAYESEKAQIERLAKPHSRNDGTSPLKADNDSIQSVKKESQNFPSVFQPNLKCLLTSGEEESLRNARKNMRVLMIINLTEYNKFMSIFLKRRSASDEELARLISLKVLSLSLIKKVLGGPAVVNLLDTRYCDCGMAFELQKKTFTKQNLRLVMNALCEDLPGSYQKLLNVIGEFSTTKNGQEQISNIVNKVQVKGGKDTFSFITDLLNLGVNNSEWGNFEPLPESARHDLFEDDGEVTEEETDVLDLFSRLNFTNLWIFQILTSLYLQSMNCLSPAKRHFALDIIELTGYDVAASKLFDKISNVEVLEKTLQTLEVDFFQRKSIKNPEVSYYYVIIETIVNISRRLNKVSTSSIPMGEESFRLMKECCHEFISKDPTDLAKLEYRLDAFLKILIVHQKFILKEGLEKPQPAFEGYSEFLRMLCQLFHKIDFSLKLKLLLYDVLASMKSFVIYSSTGRNHQLSIKKNLKVPKELLDLPPFKISSFMPDDIPSGEANKVEPGIKDRNPSDEPRKPVFFLYNKSSNTFEEKLSLRPFHLLDNFQEEGPEFNNTPLNLCLFNASYYRKNPT